MNRRASPAPPRVCGYRRGGILRLEIRRRPDGARLLITPSPDSPLTAAIEATAITRWAWPAVPPDDVFPAILAAVRRAA